MFWKRKNKSAPKKATHELYPEILQWIKGDRLEWGLIYHGSFHSVLEDCQVVVDVRLVEWHDENLIKVNLNPSLENLSLKERQLREELDGSYYAKFIEETQKAYQQLIREQNEHNRHLDNE